MHKMQVEEMRDFFSQKSTFEEICVILQTRHPCIRGYSVKSTKTFCEKKGISSGISQDHVRATISEAVADDVQKDFGKIYLFEQCDIEFLWDFANIINFLDFPW